MKSNFFRTNFIFYLLIIIHLINNNQAIKSRKPVGKGKDPLVGLSDAQLEKMMKSYGVNSKDLGVLSSSVSANKNDKTLTDVGDEDDPLKSILDKNHKMKEFKSNNEIYEKNKSILMTFNLNEKEAFNFILLSNRFDIFTKLPVTAMNIIRVNKYLLSN